MRTAADYELVACGHCGDGTIAAELTPCPFLPDNHGICGDCLGPARTCFALVPERPVVASKRRRKVRV